MRKLTSPGNPGVSNEEVRVWLATDPFFFCWQTNIIGLTWEQMYLVKKPKLRLFNCWHIEKRDIFSSISTNCYVAAARGLFIHLHQNAKIVNIFCMALRKRERQDETQFTTKIAGKASLGPSYFGLSNFRP